MSPRPLAFLDTETTGLDPDLHDVWEIGLILQRPFMDDVEAAWMIRPDLTHADPKALEISRFYHRFYSFGDGRDDPVGAGRLTHGDPDVVHQPVDAAEVAHALAELLAGAVIVGVNPAFDVAFLSRWMRRHGHVWTAHYRTIDVTTLGLGHLILDCPDYPVRGMVPSSETVSTMLDIEPAGYERHTALGDARWAKAQYDRLLGSTS
ncbi:hypothetical protein GCM10023224_05610 [Streptomonospora halophila]|uniref:Exonuclease domain-containing protein n=1 Tax=Streptomonospora halophila TaxID=427369 RepID=A0ABP9G5C9_9ACTN